MLFSSYEFLLLFLPVTLAGFACCRARSVVAAERWLLAASVVFYGCWNPAYLGLLGFSIGINFILGRVLSKGAPDPAQRRLLLALGVVFNLGLLGYYKYAGFFVDTASHWLGTDWAIGPIVLPLAISFFTFQQLAFLIDAYHRRTPTGSLVEYTLFVLFFPQLIAGPIVQHGDLLPQFADDRRFRLRWDYAAVGIATFITGLCKKVLVADSLAPTADALFDAAIVSPVAMADAWVGTLAYALQLYFDFSGYSDMAIGLGWTFGVHLPVNFNAPYQASSIIDFWRRWHITLSQFLRDYLYIPLGGSRCSTSRRFGNLLLTMLLGGLWHGAGWTFVAWGGLHGAYLVINHSWSAIATRVGWRWTRSAGYRWASRGLTFLAVLAGWVVFRAADLATAGRVLSAATGWGQNAMPATPIEPATLAFLALLTIATQFLPTTQTLIPLPGATLHSPSVPQWLRWLSWRPTAWHGAAASLLLIACITLLTRVREFLYFQF